MSHRQRTPASRLPAPAPTPPPHLGAIVHLVRNLPPVIKGLARLILRSGRRVGMMSDALPFRTGGVPEGKTGPRLRSRRSPPHIPVPGARTTLCRGSQRRWPRPEAPARSLPSSSGAVGRVSPDQRLTECNTVENETSCTNKKPQMRLRWAGPRVLHLAGTHGPRVSGHELDLRERPPRSHVDGARKFSEGQTAAKMLARPRWAK